MLFSLLSIFMSLLIPCIVLVFALIISFRTFEDQEKSSPFECGFDPKSNARIPFSLRFFLLAVIFLIFDIEIVLLMPAPLILHSLINPFTMMTLLLFFLILTLGLVHEWNEGSLNWTL